MAGAERLVLGDEAGDGSESAEQLPVSELCDVTFAHEAPKAHEHAQRSLCVSLPLSLSIYIYVQICVMPVICRIWIYRCAYTCF